LYFFYLEKNIQQEDPATLNNNILIIVSNIFNENISLEGTVEEVQQASAYLEALSNTDNKQLQKAYATLYSEHCEALRNGNTHTKILSWSNLVIEYDNTQQVKAHATILEAITLCLQHHYPLTTHLTKQQFEALHKDVNIYINVALKAHKLNKHGHPIDATEVIEKEFYGPLTKKTISANRGAAVATAVTILRDTFEQNASDDSGAQSPPAHSIGIAMPMPPEPDGPENEKKERQSKRRSNPEIIEKIKKVLKEECGIDNLKTKQYKKININKLHQDACRMHGKTFRKLNLDQPTKRFIKHVAQGHRPDGANFLNNILEGENASFFNPKEDFVALALKTWKNGTYVKANEKIYNFKRIIGYDIFGNPTSLVKVVMNNTATGFKTVFPTA